MEKNHSIIVDVGVASHENFIFQLILIVHCAL